MLNTLLEMTKDLKYIFKKNPCLTCVVRSCCSTRCKELLRWEGRFELIKLPFTIIYCFFALALLLFFGGTIWILCGLHLLDPTFKKIFTEEREDYY